MDQIHSNTAAGDNCSEIHAHRFLIPQRNIDTENLKFLETNVLGSESQDGGNSVIDDSNNKISIDLEKDSNQVAPFCAESEILMPSNENEESFLTLVPSRYAIPRTTSPWPFTLMIYGLLINNRCR